MPEPKDPLIAEGSDTPPTTLKVGDKEYTADEIAALEAEKAKLEENNKSLQSDYTKKSMELADIKKLQGKIDDINSGDASATELTAGELEDLKYFKKMGFITKEEHEKLLAQKLEEKDKESQDKETKREMKVRVEKEIDDLAAKHDFVKKDELAQYMADKAEAGTVLTTDEAAWLLYRDKFVAGNIKPEDLPSAEPSSKQVPPTKNTKVFNTEGREFNSFLKEQLLNPPVE